MSAILDRIEKKCNEAKLFIDKMEPPTPAVYTAGEADTRYVEALRDRMVSKHVLQGY